MTEVVDGCPAMQAVIDSDDVLTYEGNDEKKIDDYLEATDFMLMQATIASNYKDQSIKPQSKKKRVKHVGILLGWGSLKMA